MKLTIEEHIGEANDMIKETNDKEKQVLDWWKSDIENCFSPKCRCGKKATIQTERGKDNQKNNARPCNWGWYCQKCFNKGLKEEMEACYGR